MAETTNIEWCDSTWNPWLGCTKVSPACDDCYAARSTPARTLGVVWGPHEARRRTSESNWELPKRWERQHQEFFAQHGRRRRVFCASLADVFDNEVDPAWRADLFELIAATPHLDWLLLTKRIGNARPMIAEATAAVEFNNSDIEPWTTDAPWPNVWLGATICNQPEYDRDIGKLRRTPAAVHFLSIEPMLGPIDMRMGGASLPDYSEHRPLATLDWVICGGESGPKARPMHPDWPRSLRDQCAAAGVPFLFKQWGEWCPRGPESLGYPLVDGVPRIRLTDAGQNGQRLGADGGNDVWMNRAGKKASGRLLDGVEHNGFPEVAHA